MFHLLKCQLKSRLSFSFTHSLAPLVYVYVWQWLAATVAGLIFSPSVSLYFCFLHWGTDLQPRCQAGTYTPVLEYCDPLILCDRKIMSFGQFWPKPKSVSKTVLLFNHEIVITSPPPHPFTNGLPQTSPFYGRHMLILKLIANYHGLNDLTPPPSLQMIHIILSPFQ